MATVKKGCAKCEKGTGIFTCDGCRLSFCRKHSEQHREELSIQMDNLGQEYDLFQRNIDNDMKKNQFLSRIDIWERKSIEKIQQIARQTRNDFNEMIDKNKNEMKKIFDRLINEFQTSRQLDDYTEIELNKWLIQLKTLQQDYQQSINVQLEYEDNNSQSIIHLIKIKSLSHSKQSIERFDISDKEIQILENGFLAKHIIPQLTRPAIVFGINHYSQGQHQIRFLIENKFNHSFFIGIISISQIDIFTDTSTIHGWWPNYAVIENGIFRVVPSISDVQQGDELTLAINCNERILYFHHQRTNEGLQILVDINRCPLPWKLILRSTETENSIRILN